jgi:amino acid adenylation domain-containing protein
MLVHDFLTYSANRYPEKTALVCGGARYTYRQLDEETNKLAHALSGLGVQRGDRVVVHLPNTRDAVVAVFGILKAGACFVFIHPTTKEDKLLYIIHDCRAAALITHSQSRRTIDRIRQNAGSIKAVLLCETGAGGGAGAEPGAGAESGAGSATGTQAGTKAQNGAGPVSCTFCEAYKDFPETPPARRTIDQDLACLIYTSGSTGDPKGVVSGHNNVVFVSGSIITYLENTPEDVVINFMPFSFDYGLYQLLMVFRFGGTLVLENSFSYVAHILDKMQKERVTGLPGVPTIFALLHRINLATYDLSRLRYITNTAAAWPVSHIQQLRASLPHVKLHSMYGLTECKRALHLPPDEINERPGSVGVPIPGTEAWIVDGDGNRLGSGETGELVIRGSHVMRGYWNDTGATSAVYRPGPTPGERVLYSGDYFTVDEDGYFYFQCRKDDVFKSRGEKVSPTEIEKVLYQLEGIVETAVIGVSDDVAGNAVKAFIVRDGEHLTENDVKHHCSKHLESYLVPQFIEFRESLPKSSNGKINKLELKK